MQRLSRTRAVLFYLILAALVWLAAEAAAAVYHRVVHGDWYDFDATSARQRAVIDRYREEAVGEREQDLAAIQRARQRDDADEATDRGDNWSREEVLHPYLGYVVDYHDPRCPDIGFCDSRLRDYTHDFFERRDNTLYVGVFGGSFGQGVAINSSAGKLERELGRHPAFAGKDIVVYTLALGGYKQPQQLMTLNYFLVQGLPLDLVINIDGYNEMVLPLVEGIAQGTHPIFPRSWARRLRGSYNKTLLLLLARAERLKSKREEMAQLASRPPFRYSILAGTYWSNRDRRYERNIARTLADFAEYRAGDRLRATYAARGPDYPRDITRHTIDDLVSIWREASAQMHHLANANGAHYFHFLQPNQYLEGSKPMSEEEREVAIMERGEFATLALDNYRELATAGDGLRGEGVAFFDLTQVYRDHPEPLYRDACCHVNERGYDIIAEVIAGHIGETLGDRRVQD